LEEYFASKKTEIFVVKMENSDARFVFDYQYKIKDVLGPTDFIKI
jgi:hypothetical protein